MIKKNIVLTKEQQFILKEREKCSKNPIYFLEKYGKVLTEANEPEAFKLYNFQKEKCIIPFLKYDTIAIAKGRQTGVSTIAAGYALWKMCFIPNFLVVVLAIDKDTAQNIIEKIQLLVDNVPGWLMPKQTMKNKHSIGFKNKSKIIAMARGGKKGRSYSPKLLIFDEAAFIEDAETVFVAAIPGLAKTRGQLIAISTPNGVGNWFYRVIHESPENGFHTEKIYWYEMPDRDEAWKEKELARLGPKMFGQEYNIDWLQSGSTVISVDDIMWQQKNNVCEPKEMINISDPDNAIKKLNREKEVWIWENPIPGRYYVVSCDVSRGDSSDFSAFSVWKLPTEEDISTNVGPVQVAEFKGMIKTDDYGKLINVIGLTYNNAIVIVENNSLGIATLNVLVEKEYPNLYFTDKAAKQISFDEAVNLDSVASVPGFATTAKTRPLIADATEAAWRSHQYIIRSKRMLIEAQTWIWINGRAEHEQGCHDDLMMSSGIFYYLYQTSLKRQGISHDRFIGALNLVTERKEKEKYDILDKIKIVKQQQKNSWILNYGADNKENWNLSEMVRTKLK